MKVVLFCGGMGMRLREFSESIPKPLVPIGDRPILWHLMKYYAHFGHKDFILCLGWKGHLIKEFFTNYNECVSNNFVLRRGGSIDLLNSDIHDWTITFVDTGRAANIGQRLAAVRPYLDGEPVFLANYADGLSDLHLPDLVSFFQERGSLAACLGVRPRQSFHLVDADADGTAKNLEVIAESNLWMNGGFFVLDAGIFDYMREGEELVLAPFQRLMAERRLHMYRYGGFWGCMDTYKEMQLLEDMYHRGDAPWELWRNDERTAVELAIRRAQTVASGEWRAASEDSSGENRNQGAEVPSIAANTS